MRRPKARNDWVIIQDKNPAGRIVLPEMGAAAQAGSKVVVDVGPGRYSDAGVLIPMQARVGDEVLFGGGVEGKNIDGQVYWFLRDEQLQGVAIDDGEPVPEAARLVLQ